jgi:DNA invertase Pin-like site-specific DNA recombinase
MALIGYARVSTQEQHAEAQTDALSAAGCEKLFVEHASGVLARRPALDDALAYLRDGDTLVVTKLDRLGRSVKNLKDTVDDLQARGIGLKALSQGIDTTTPGGRLFFHMLAAIAEFEHDLIVERTHDGLAAARARGRKGGGRFKMTPTKAKQARAMYDTRQHTVQEIAETFGVSRGTIYRHLTEDSGS